MKLKKTRMWRMGTVGIRFGIYRLSQIFILGSIWHDLNQDFDFQCGQNHTFKESLIYPQFSLNCFNFLTVQLKNFSSEIKFNPTSFFF